MVKQQDLFGNFVDDGKPEKSEVTQRDPKKTAFNKRKAELRGIYKRFKVGMIGEEDLTDEQKFLLVKYYGVKIQGD